MLRNGLEPWHLLIVAIVVIALFGSKRLPDMARSLGKSMRILKREAKAMKEEGAAPSAPLEPTSVRTAETAETPTPATHSASTPAQSQPPTAAH
jgi:sec-independent protein translocase protein TatA